MGRSSGHDLVHFHVGCVDGDLVDELKVEADPYFVGLRNVWEEAVVIASSPSQAMARRVESHAGDNGDVDMP